LEENDNSCLAIFAIFVNRHCFQWFPPSWDIV